MSRFTRDRNTRTLVGGLLLCATLLLSACGFPFTSSTAQATPHRGGNVVDAMGFDPSLLLPTQLGSPVEVTVANTIWAPLWYGDQTGALHPGLASEVPSQENRGISADLKTWTIHLKSNLKWSDGSPLTADDLVFSLNTFANPHFAASFPHHDPNDSVDFLGATKVDTNVVQFTLAHPYVGMTAVLADGAAGPIPQEVFGAMQPADIPKSHESFFPTVTSGPFKMSEHVTADHITVTRNPYYYQGPDKPYLDQITFKIFPSIQAILDAAQAGTIDTAYGSGSVISASQLDDLHALAGYSTHIDQHPAGYEVMVFNLTNPILKDKTVRQALALSLDPKQIIARAKPGTAVPICDDHAGTFAHEPTLTCYPQDLARARQLLDQDGWTLGGDGVRHKGGQTLELSYSTSGIPLHTLRASGGPIAQAAWAQIGVRLDIHDYLHNQFFGPSGPDGAWDIVEFGGGLGYDPDDHNNFMCDQTHDQGGNNVMHYCNPAVDQAETAQQTTTNQATRLAAFKAIHRAILDDLPLMYLYDEASVGVYRSTLRNYMPFTINDTWNCWDWYLDQR